MAKKTTFILIRHGETEYTKSHRIHGSTDAPLTEKGLLAAHKTAEYFAGQHFDAIYTSPLGRAQGTAQIIAKAVGVEPVPEPGFEERAYGWLEGKSIRIFEPDLSGPKLFLPIVKFALKMSGEDSDAFLTRVTNAFDRIAERHPGQCVMIVTHWMPISVLYLYLSGKDLQEYRNLGPWTACGISEFRGGPGDWNQIRLNEGHHLL